MIDEVNSKVYIENKNSRARGVNICRSWKAAIIIFKTGLWVE